MINEFRYHVGQYPQSFHAFRISGSDVESFLQDQSTFNVSTLEEGSFHLNAFLDPQGRVECYGWLVRAKDYYIYLVPEKLKEEAIERLNRYLISEDVTIDGPFWEDWLIVVGPETFDSNFENSFTGSFFADEAILLKSLSLPDLKKIPSADLELWRGLTGWPTFNGDHFQKEIINNSRLFDLCVSNNKGCYPGQETVSKIATRRGAAYSPVLLEVTHSVLPGPVSNFDKKIGEVTECLEWDHHYYLSASLLRDFRVEGMRFSGNMHGEDLNFQVRYFPLISGSREEKSQELFYEATDFFKKDNNESAEECFKLALKLNPHHADALESLGVLLGRLNRFDEAIELMQKLSVADPHSVLAHTNMSLYLMKLGKIEEAEEQKSLATVKSFQKFGEEAKFKESVEKEKSQKAQEWAQRESMFIQVLEIDEEDTLANYGLGAIAVEREDWVKARMHLEKVLKADPKYSVAYLALGRALSALKLKDEARKIYVEGIKVAAAKGDLMPANQMQFEMDRL